jgi:hypothetical protein
VIDHDGHDTAQTEDAMELIDCGLGVLEVANDAVRVTGSNEVSLNGPEAVHTRGPGSARSRGTGGLCRSGGRRR